MTLSHEDNKLIIFERGDLLYIFNFHHNLSQYNFKVGTKDPSDHFILFETDEKRFSGS